MNGANGRTSGVCRVASKRPSAPALVLKCHDMLNTAATLLATVEFLVDPRMGSKAEREAAGAEALASVMKLASAIREVQGFATGGDAPATSTRERVSDDTR
jgi:hypothetical protein